MVFVIITVDVSFKTLTSVASTLMIMLRLVPTPLGPIYAAVQLDTVWLLTGTHVKVNECDIIVPHRGVDNVFDVGGLTSLRAIEHIYL